MHKNILIFALITLTAILVRTLPKRNAILFAPPAENVTAPLTTFQKQEQIISSKVLGSSQESSSATIEVIPPGPQDPGEQYEVKVTVKVNGGVCKNCPIEWSFQDQMSGDEVVSIEQPGDALIPHGDTTNERGEAKVTVTSYAPNRTLMVKATLPGGSPITKEVLLPYEDKPLLAFIKLVTYYVGKGYVLPPFGNVLAKATKQVYIGGDTREIFLEWNTPLGARRFDTYAFNTETMKVDPIYHSIYGAQDKKTYLVKTTPEAKTSIQVPALVDVGINVRACTTGENCVDAPPLRIPKITDSLSTSASGVFSIPNFGLLSPSENYETSLKEEQNFLQQFFGPVMNWLKEIYSLFI